MATILLAFVLSLCYQQFVVFRCDIHSLGQAEPTGSGGLRVPATLARSGIQEYLQPDGSVRREYRPPDEVASEQALASFRGVPVTAGHPGQVTPESWRTVSVGHLGDDVRSDGQFVTGVVYVLDQQALDRVQSRELVELSAGYEIELDSTPGQTPEGERYDAVQRQIRANHVALLPRGQGRAGREVRLRLDCSDNQVIDSENLTEETQMSKTIEESVKFVLRFDGVEYPVWGAESVRQAWERWSHRTESLQADLELATTRVDQERARADAAEQALTEANDPIKLQAAVAERVRFEQAVRSVQAEVRTDGRSEEEILRELFSEKFRLDGSESIEYLRGLLAASCSLKEKPKVEETRIDKKEENVVIQMPWQPFHAMVGS